MIKCYEEALSSSGLKGIRRRPSLLCHFRISFPRGLCPVNAVKLISAILMVFQIKQVALTWDLNRLEIAVLSLTREKKDSNSLGGPRVFSILPRKDI